MPPPPPKPVAAIVTLYRRNSHADVILSRILDGYNERERPNLRLVSLYVDQVGKDDLSRTLAEKHGFRLCPTIADAVTLGTEKVAVDGVIIIGEHGNYPNNEKGQHLYPRRKFFEEVAVTFEKAKRSVPVFSDKHLSATWDDAKWVYDRARTLYVPFLAGSSVPVTWRRPTLQLPRNCVIRGAVQIGYGPFEAYGFHAIEGMQCMLERRKGGETGVRAVQMLTGKAIWDAMDAGKISKDLLEEAIRRVPAKQKGDYREITSKNERSAVMLIEYRDGLTVPVVMLNGVLLDSDGGGFAFAGKLDGETEPRSTQFYLQDRAPFGHFGYLVRAIESMIQTGHAPYPVERTLLTTGILDAAMTSLHEKGKRIETPHLAIKYTPTDWPPAADPIPEPLPKKPPAK